MAIKDNLGPLHARLDEPVATAIPFKKEKNPSIPPQGNEKA